MKKWHWTKWGIHMWFRLVKVLAKYCGDLRTNTEYCPSSLIFTGPKWPGISKMFPQEALPYPKRDLFLLNGVLYSFEGEWLKHSNFSHGINHRLTPKAALLLHPVSLPKVIKVILLSCFTVHCKLKTQFSSLANRNTQKFFLLKEWKHGLYSSFSLYLLSISFILKQCYSQFSQPS